MASALHESPQAILPEWEPAALSYSVPVAMRNQVDPPRVITLDGNAQKVFDARPTSPAPTNLPTPLFGDLKVVSKLIIQLIGANALYVGVNTIVDENNFHQYIPANANGAQIDLSDDQVDYVSVKGTAGDKVAVYISYPKQSQPF